MGPTDDISMWSHRGLHLWVSVTYLKLLHLYIRCRLDNGQCRPLFHAFDLFFKKSKTSRKFRKIWKFWIFLINMEFFLNSLKKCKTFGKSLKTLKKMGKKSEFFLSSHIIWLDQYLYDLIKNQIFFYVGTCRRYLSDAHKVNPHAHVKPANYVN